MPYNGLIFEAILSSKRIAYGKIKFLEITLCTQNRLGNEKVHNYIKIKPSNFIISSMKISASNITTARTWLVIQLPNTNFYNTLETRYLFLMFASCAQ